MRHFTTAQRSGAAFAVVAMGVLAVPAHATAPTAPPPPVADQQSWPTLSDEYIEGVREALRSGTDLWGEHVMSQPGGATFANVKDYLVPLTTGGVATNEPDTGSMGISDTGYVYLPLTLPRGDTHRTQSPPEPSDAHYALHTADGSGITSDWHASCAAAPYTKDYSEAFNARCDNFRRTAFFVGADGQERYGSDLGRLEPPTLREGYLPILQTTYRDADGVRYEQESFAGRVARTDSLVSLVKLTVHGVPGARSVEVRVNIDDPAASTLRLERNRVVADRGVELAFTGPGRLEGEDLILPVDLSRGSRTVYLTVLNNPDEVKGRAAIAGAGIHDRARAGVTKYWKRQLQSRTDISVPEPYVMNAMRSLLLQNLTMGWKYSLGNFYEQPYVPEMVDTVSELGEFGHEDDYRENLQTLLDYTKGGPAYPVVYRNWEQGSKLAATARYYDLTNDARFVRDNLPRLRSYLDDFRDQVTADPNGILEQQRCCEDEWSEGYWTHHQLSAWQGWRDMLRVLREIGRADVARTYATTFEGFTDSLREAIDASMRELPDGSLFLPRELLADHDAYDAITESRESSYWNLLTYYGYASGFFTPDEQEKLLQYVHTRGGLFLGMVRFNYTGQPIGECKPDGLAGYEGTGVDQVYGYQYTRLLSQADQPERQVLSLYGQLAHGFSRNTFMVGEGANIDPCPELGFFRSSWLAPLSANNATWLKTLRETLVREVTDRTGATSGLDLAFATPRGWLADGKQVRATNLPTAFGPVSVSISSQLRHGQVRATVDVPRSARDAEVRLRLRAPADHELVGVRAGRRTLAFDAETQTVDLSGHTGPIQLVATFTDGR